MLLLSVFAICTQLSAQNRTITGTITDATGKAIPNASVQIKGSTTGTVTNESGAFTLNVLANARTVTVSSVGYASVDVAIGGKTTITTELKTEDQALSEVVVVAYGTSKKSSYTPVRRFIL